MNNKIVEICKKMNSEIWNNIEGIVIGEGEIGL